MYKSGDVKWGSATDTRTENYEYVTGAYLRHSCNAWVIGDEAHIQALIDDLVTMLKARANRGSAEK